MSVLRCNGRRRKTASAGRSKCSVGAKMGRRGWRRRLSPIAPRWRNGRASRNHSIRQLGFQENNLARVLETLGGREEGTARLEEALVAYRAALEERTRERAPLNWARTQTNLGNDARTLGERENGTARLEEAVAPIARRWRNGRASREPLDWAMTQNSLARMRWRHLAAVRTGRRGWRRRSRPIAPRLEERP